MRRTRAGWLVVLAAVLGVTPAASAQTQVGGMNVEGEVEAGVRAFIERPSRNERAKFEEYRDITQGPILQELRLRIFRPDGSYSAEIEGSKWGQEDQEFSLRAGRLGLWQFGFDWDQTPHVFSTNARSMFIETSPGVLTLPAPRPVLPGAGNDYNQARELGEIGTRWDTARIFIGLTPTPDLELRAEYTRIHKGGNRITSLGFGSPGVNAVEVAEPVDQTIDDFRLRGELAREQWQVQFGYTLSIFRNSLNKLIVDNPCSDGTAGAKCAGGDGDVDTTAGFLAPPARGQMALPPDNMAHTFNIAGGANLPLRTRLNASAGYSLQLQNQSFLPHTINPVVDGHVDLALPQNSLNGNVQTFLANVSATSRPLRPLTLRAKYRFYDFHDLSDEPIFPGHVVNDRPVDIDPTAAFAAGPTMDDRRAGRFAYSKHNADLDARWQVLRPVALTLGTGWERWDRNRYREVEKSDELYAKAAVDVTPFDWLLARMTYRPSFRRIERYNTRAHIEHVVDEDDAALNQGQSLLLRKLDESERDRHRFDVTIQLAPFETLTVTPTASYRYDDYIASVLGLQAETSWSAGVDFSWAPIERASFSGGYVHERNKQKMRSRNRPVTGTVTFDFADFEWVSDIVDTVDTAWAGLKLALIPKVLDWTANGSYAYALGRQDTNNPVWPSSGTAAQNATARAKEMSAFQDTLIRLDTALRYHFLKQWTASLGYVFESFQKNDWRTDQIRPFVPGVTAIYLGNDLQNYAAHIVGVTMSYRFK